MFKQHAQSILNAMPANRLLALDVFRGLTIAAMVLVNNPGSWSYVYSPMLHAQWHGWTVTDLIFPFFVFIIGVSIHIVTSRLSQQPQQRWQFIKQAGVRSLKLFGLGLFLALFYYNVQDANYSWWQQQVESIRVMGVLQRLGLVFFITVLIVLFFANRGRWIWMGGILLGYWAMLMLVPYGDNFEFQGELTFGNNLVAWVDHSVFAAKNLYYSQAIPFAFDPEGLLSTIPAVAGCLAGVFCGQLLTDKQQTLLKKCQTMFVVGLVLLLTGELWGLLFPINKALWTSSYVLMSTGWALVVLASLVWLLDIKKWSSWSAPFVVFGTNAILFYMLTAVIARILLMIPVGDFNLHHWLYNDVFQPLFGNYNGSLMFAISFMCISYLMMYWFYKRNIFWKV